MRYGQASNNYRAINTEGPVSARTNHQRARPVKTVHAMTHDNTTPRLRDGRAVSAVSAGMLCIALAKFNGPFIQLTADGFNVHPVREQSGSGAKSHPGGK